MSTLRDPYLVLGVARSASAEDVKQAYRRLAKLYHPDVNPGRADIEQRFKDVTAAYQLLSDPERRARYDRGEIDANGSERPRAHQHGFGGGPWGDGFESDDLFGDLFGRRRRKSEGASGFRARGSDIAYSVTVSFVEAALGTRRRISLSSGKTLDVTIPPGTQDQRKLRLRGQGLAGLGGGPAGDAIVEIQVEPHPFFTRKDQDVHLDLPVTLPEAVLGATIKVPTLEGHVALKVPPGSNTGTVLRLRGKGIPDAGRGAAGDQYVRLKVVLPEPPDSELAELVERWARTRSYDVRRKAGME